MAQVLKDEIRENILKAALQEFYEKGYRPAAMREIFDKSSGTKYETEKDRFIAAIEEHLNKHKKDTDGDEIFIHIIANNFVDGLMQVMYHYKGKEWAMMILHKLSEMYLSGIGL